MLIIFAILLQVVSCSNDIPLPTLPQLEYQQREIVGLTHFNMATFFHDGDPGCNSTNWHLSGNPLSFNPTSLNVSNWVEHYKSIGAKSAVLTAKHGCGFTLWPTNVTIPSTGEPYGYSVQYSSYPHDVIKQFTQECTKQGLGFGFYYSLTNNYYLHILGGSVSNEPLLPGQINTTLDEFHTIALAQLKELFTQYGNLSEFWFDGGTFDLAANVSSLLNEYQPNCAVFNGQDVSANMVRWIGTETGLINEPVWSLGENSGAGDPNSTQFCPACCDSTLQCGDHWFFTPGDCIHNLTRLIAAYHDSVGNNAVLELDFAIDRTGNVNTSQSRRYKEFGNWINNCYGNPIAETNGIIYKNNSNGNNYGLTLSVGGSSGSSGSVGVSSGVSSSAGVATQQFDRIMIQENLKQGQRVRKFNVFVNGTSVVSSTAVGQKRIVIFDKTYNGPATVTLNVTDFVGDSVNIVNYAVFAPCTV